MLLIRSEYIIGILSSQCRKFLWEFWLIIMSLSFLLPASSGIFSEVQVTLSTCILFFCMEKSDILASVQCDIHKPERQTCSLSCPPCMTSPCLLLIKRSQMAVHGIWSQYANFDHYNALFISHTCCVCGMCHAAAYPVKGSESEHQAWKRTREKRAAQFIQGEKECSAVCLQHQLSFYMKGLTACRDDEFTWRILENLECFSRSKMLKTMRSNDFENKNDLLRKNRFAFFKNIFFYV